MLEACARQLAARNLDERPLLYAVTVLTSLTDNEIREIGWSGTSDEVVARLAGLAQESGLDGVVCSAMEAEFLKGRFGSDMGLVTPGIRPAFAVQGISSG